ncbi:MAG: PQQ-dependent sugar dehydrogenase [Pseudomonadota bacterium]
MTQHPHIRNHPARATAFARAKATSTGTDSAALTGQLRGQAGAGLTRRGLLALGGAALAAPLLGRPVQAMPDGAQITRMARGLDEPWSLAFLPDGAFLVTERDGRLSLFSPQGGQPVSVAGVPEVAARGQGGLFDVMVPRDFASTRAVYLVWAKRQRGGAGTALGVGRLAETGDRLEDFQVVFEMAAGTSGGRHFGGRVVEMPDGTLVLTTGDRGDRPTAQNLASHAGKLIRLNRDGSVPPDNPFLGRADLVLPEILSYGHRNAQGLALDAQGQLWTSAHGARGGDEVNLIQPGANYGWPVISYGRHYSGLRIGEGSEKPGMEQPKHYWDPSIAPSGHAILSDRMFPEWAGRHVIGSLKFDYIAVLDPRVPAETGWAETPIKSAETRRVRDVREAPDGAIWFLSVGQGAVYRIGRGTA